MNRKPEHRVSVGAASARPDAPGREIIDDILAGARFERVWRIHAHLSRDERITTRSLADELGVSSRTIKRDLELMATRLGMPIEWDPGEHSFVYTRPCDTLPLLRLDPREALALALAGRLFDRWNGTPSGSPFSQVIQRIAPLFGGVLSIAAESMDSAISAPRGDGTSEIAQLPELLQATLDQSVLKLRYAKPAATRVERRVVHPLHLTELDGRWMLFAYDPARATVRTFRVSRIRSFEVTSERFDRPSDFDAARYLLGCMGRFAGDRDIEVRIALDAFAAIYAREQPWHPSQQLTELPDGGVVMTLTVSHLADVKAAILKWGEHAEALAPAELRNQVSETLQKAGARYSK